MHSAFMLSKVKLLLKREVGVCALNSHGNYMIVDHGKSWKSHGIVFLNFCRNPVPENLYCSHTLNMEDQRGSDENSNL